MTWESLAISGQLGGLKVPQDKDYKGTCFKAYSVRKKCFNGNSSLLNKIISGWPLGILNSLLCAKEQLKKNLHRIILVIRLSFLIVQT